MFWAGVLKILGDRVTASWMSHALFACAIGVTLWRIVSAVMEEISERAMESKTGQNLRIYLDRCRRESEGRLDTTHGIGEPKTFENPTNPTARVMFRPQAAQAYGARRTPGFKDLGVPNTQSVEAGLALFDAILWRDTDTRPSLVLPGCVMFRRPASRPPQP